MMMMIMIVRIMMMMMMNGWLLSLPAVFRKLWSMLVKVNKYAIIFSFPFSNAIMTMLFPIGIIMISNNDSNDDDNNNDVDDDDDE